jgi:crotonobetainyl-CoA:carnitine CoA-transferase CaiB-like acyl-CoA transferase
MVGPPLAGFRVVDLATPRAEFAGRILADLGAEVIKVEPPGGAAARWLPPFESDVVDADGSLYWAAVALGKKGVVLDIDDPVDRKRLLDLVATADVFVESSDPGEMAARGLAYADLAALNSRLVYVSVTPFGQHGPAAAAPATDLTLEAAGGLLGMQGDGDRPPVPVGYPQASFHAGAQAAADAIIALHERERSGLGQHLDVSMQAAVVWTLMNATGYPPNTGGDPPGYGEQRDDPPAQLFPGLTLPRQHRCKDGWIVYQVTLPAIGPRTHAAVMDWADRLGLLPAALRDCRWDNWIAEVQAGAISVDLMKASLDVAAAVFEAHTKLELQTFAVQEGILISPIYTVEDLLADPHLAARDYWVDVGGRRHPGPFAKLSATPIRLDRPAPRLGEHQALLASVPRRVPPPATAVVDRRQAFAGLKVADFAWVGVGPIISKALADHGATVVHVESATRPDVLRLVPPFKDGIPGIDRSQFMANFNSSKFGLACDLKTPEGQEIAWRLIEWADVVVESFTPGTMSRFGIGYDEIAKRKPDIVMLSTCLRGQTGPERGYTGFGGQGAALAGIHSITGWPDRAPCGPWGAYTDFINPRYGVAALAAAIIHRQRTGEGQHIDLAQTEAGIHFIEPVVLDFTVNGRAWRAQGHDSLYASPHGVYRAQGKERYVAIAVETPAQWQALSALAGLRLGADSLEARQARRTEVDATLARWCAARDAFEAAAALRDAGVPAYAVLRPSDLYRDPQLVHREFFATLDHSVMGPTPYDGLVTKFSATPGCLRKAAPCLGEDTDHVLRDILALSDDEIAACAAAGALQ